ncbi:hypothetical protein GCM10027048_20210 [Hymenobacter coalescens]
MTIRIKLTVTGGQRWQDPSDDRIGGYIYFYTYWEFDTLTHAVVTGSGSDQRDYGDAPLEDYSAVGEFWHECLPNTTTRRGWLHHGDGTFYTVDDDQATECGWNGATCDLQLAGTVVGFTATGVATGAHGAVRYSLDGGATTQASPTFTALQRDTDYVMTAIDEGVGNCRRTWAFRIEEAPVVPVVPPAPEPAGLDYSQHPLWHVVGGLPAGREVVLELFVERQHYAGDYRRVVQLQLRAGADGRVAFRLDRVLHRQLAAFVVPALGPHLNTVRQRDTVRNYFVRTAPVVATTGLPGAWTTGALRTVLRGGLPYEWRDTPWLQDYYETHGVHPFMTWQPRGKRVTVQQPEWWSWLCPAGTPHVVRVRRRYRFAAAPDFVSTEAVVVGPSAQPTTYRLLALPLLAGTMPGAVGVDLWLEDSTGTRLSEVADFLIEPARPRTRYFLFTNSLGGVDALRTTGRLDGTLDTKEELGSRVAEPGTAPRAAQQFVVSADVTRRLKVRTGFLTAAQWDWLQELVLAQERWEARGAQLLPLLLTKGSLAYARDERPLSGFEFEYEYAFDATAYARLHA